MFIEQFKRKKHYQTTLLHKRYPAIYVLSMTNHRGLCLMTGQSVSGQGWTLYAE